MGEEGTGSQTVPPESKSFAPLAPEVRATGISLGNPSREPSPAPGCYYPVHEVQSFLGPAEKRLQRPEQKKSSRATPPSPELVIITGMSGSGKASVLKAFEDLGTTGG